MMTPDINPVELKVFLNHIYELKKGVRQMVLYTTNKRYEGKYSVNHVFSSRTSIINFTSKKQSYDDTRRSGRDNEPLPIARYC